MTESDLVIRNKVAQYLLLNEEMKSLKAQQAKLKEELEPALLAAETNARGSHVLPFSQNVSVGGVNYTNLQRVRKESKVLNEERAVEFLYEMARDRSPDGIPFKESKWFDPIVTVEHIDQDELWNLFVQDEITQEELDSLFDITITWAFQPTKE